MSSISRRFSIVFQAAIVVALAMAPLATSGPAWALLINFQDPSTLGRCGNLTPPTQTCTGLVGGTINTGGTGNLFAEVFRGVNGLGVTGGSNDLVPGEVDQGELLNLVVSRAPERVFSLEFGRLFGLNSGDDQRESVVVSTNVSMVLGILTLDADEDSATWEWTMNGSQFFTKPAITIDPSICPSAPNDFPCSPNPFGAGWYRIDEPFGGVRVLSLTLRPGPNVGSGTNDFAFVGISASAPLSTPEPSTLLLLATGILTYGWRKRAGRSLVLLSRLSWFVITWTFRKVVKSSRLTEVNCTQTLN